MPKLAKESLLHERQRASSLKGDAGRAIGRAREVLDKTRNAMQVSANRRALWQLQVKPKKKGA